MCVHHCAGATTTIQLPCIISIGSTTSADPATTRTRGRVGGAVALWDEDVDEDVDVDILVEVDVDDDVDIEVE